MAAVWLEGPSIADCRDTIRLTCQHPGVPLKVWTWSRTYGMSAEWQQLFQNGVQLGPSPITMTEEHNGSLTLVFQGGRDVEGYWTCGVGGFESPPIYLRKECKPTSASISITDYQGKKQAMIRLTNVYPPQHTLKFYMELAPKQPLEVPVSFLSQSGWGWAPDLTWVTAIPEGIQPGTYTYTLEITTLTKTVLNGTFS